MNRTNLLNPAACSDTENEYNLPSRQPELAPALEQTSADLLGPLIAARLDPAFKPATGVGFAVARLIGLTNNGRTPVVYCSGQRESSGIVAKTVVDLHGGHIGREVIVVFEGADESKPIVMGVIRDGEGWPVEKRPVQVELEADGTRMIVGADDQLVLRCGKASITLTKEGKVLVSGTYVQSHSTGLNRIKGGSVQIN